MKRLCYLSICAMMAMLCLVACQQDDEVNGMQGDSGFGYVTLRIGSVGAAPVTRWNDDNALADRSEMMYNWIVLLVQDNVVTNVFSKAEVAPANAEIDEVYNGNLPAGTYTAYSFANISEASLKSILGVETLEGATLTGIDTKTTTIGANGKTAEDLTADNAFGFGSKGIPMSNKQTFTLNDGEEMTKDLIVVRMVAKLEFRFFNASGSEQKVKSVTISDVTKATTNNIFLLPKYTDAANTDKMTFEHQDLQPNLNNGSTNTAFATEDVTFTGNITVGSGDTYNIAKLQPGSAYDKKFTFYINESDKPANADHLFFLTVELDNNDYRYALVSSGTNTGLTVNKTDGGNNEDPTQTPVTDAKRTENWDYIARNDYRIIPIVLDDYKLEIVPYDFPAIGVYPVSVSTVDENAHLYEFLFHDYGHFHLVPKVTHNNGTEAVDFVATAPVASGTPATYSISGGDGKATARWGLIGDQWINSFFSYTDETAASVLTPALNSSEVKFYGRPDLTGLPANNVYPEALPVYGTNFDGEVTHTISGKIYSQGDFPMFDAETQWKPKAADAYLPYIFGQIAPQDYKADKKVYHELRVYVYVNAETVPRQLIYRFYMHLKQDIDYSSRLRQHSRCCR